jgi:hypothetical protein
MKNGVGIKWEVGLKNEMMGEVARGRALEVDRSSLEIDHQ